MLGPVWQSYLHFCTSLVGFSILFTYGARLYMILVEDAEGNVLLSTFLQSQSLPFLNGIMLCVMVLVRLQPSRHHPLCNVLLLSEGPCVDSLCSLVVSSSEGDSENE